MRTRALPALSIPLLTAVAAATTLACAHHGGSASSSPGASSDALALVDRALAAQGGAQVVAGIRTLSVKGSSTFFEPEQSYAPGGEARLLGDSTFASTRDLVAGKARIDWTRKFVYPGPREYRYTEVVTPLMGAVLGIDSAARTKQDQDANPPHHAMSGVRLAAAQRELLRTSPRLLFDARANPASLSRVPDVEAGGVKYPAVSYAAGAATFIVAFDPQTGLPARIRTMDADNIHGDSTYDLILSDWREAGPVKLPFAQRYELDGMEIVRTRIDEVSVTPPAPGTFDIPPDLLASAPRPATGAVPYQWILRRIYLGIYLDSDQIYFDPQASPGLKLVDLAPGVSQQVGGTHNALVVELDDGLAVVDAPVDEGQARFTLEAAKARYPGKPIRWLVLSHHHMDHAGGLRAYVADGANLVVGAGAADHYRRALAAPDRLSGGALASHPRRPEITEVTSKTVLGAGARTLEIYPFENPHASDLVLPYVPQARLAFVVDVWSPGRDKLGDTLTPGQAALVAAVRKAGIAPERLAGGHGSVGDYAPLEALAKK